MIDNGDTIPEQGDIFDVSPQNIGKISSKKNSVKKKKNSEESFETLLNRLEVIVGKMESGGLSLDESMSLYEEGIKKADTLTAKLADARNKVMKLVENKDGDMSLDVFDEDEYS